MARCGQPCLTVPINVRARSGGGGEVGGVRPPNFFHSVGAPNERDSCVGIAGTRPARFDVSDRKKKKPNRIARRKVGERRAESARGWGVVSAWLHCGSVVRAGRAY